MTIGEVLQSTNNSNFHIHKYELLKSPLSRRIAEDPTKGFDNSDYTEAEKNQLFNETIMDIIIETYQVIAIPSVASSIIINPEIDIHDASRLIARICNTITCDVVGFDNSEDCMSVMDIPSDISICVVKSIEEFDFKKILSYIECKMRGNSNFKLILVSHDEFVSEHFLPIINKYNKYA